jgi:hypothetical protein
MIIYRRRVSDDDPNSNSAAREFLLSVLTRHEEREGTLLATYVKSLAVFITLLLAMPVPPGLLIALIVLLAIGQPKAATPLAFAIAPSFIMVPIAVQFAMAIARSYLSWIRGRLTKLRMDILSEIGL